MRKTTVLTPGPHKPYVGELTYTYMSVRTHTCMNHTWEAEKEKEVESHQSPSLKGLPLCWLSDQAGSQTLLERSVLEEVTMVTVKEKL